MEWAPDWGHLEGFLVLKEVRVGDQSRLPLALVARVCNHRGEPFALRISHKTSMFISQIYLVCRIVNHRPGPGSAARCRSAGRVVDQGWLPITWEFIRLNFMRLNFIRLNLFYPNVCIRVFQKWHFVKKKYCNTSTHPSGVYINQIQKLFSVGQV